MSRARRGLSLIEVIVVLAILVFMGAISYQLLLSGFELRDALSENDEVNRQGRVAMARIRRDLELAFLTEHVQAINQYETVFVGDDGNPDTLFFATTSHQRLYRDARESDQTEITLWAEPSREGEGYTLYHREAPRIDDEPAEGGVVYPLAHNVKLFNLRYLDNSTNEWKTEWDMRKPEYSQRLPRAVEVSLVLYGKNLDDPDDPVEIPFLTTIIIFKGKPITRSAWSNSQEAAIAAEEAR